MTTTRSRTSRRHFLKSSSALAAGAVLSSWRFFERPAVAASRRRLSANEKLNLGIIGAGGRGGENLKGVESENIVALCDVDEVNAAGAFKKYPSAKRYQDFRVMLEKEKSLDAVVVSTPDHIHTVASVTAMRLGKHVYCEKPLTRSIWEARLMRETAAKYKVATQMRTQGHAFEGTRRAVEVLRAGAIGEVRELHVWSDRPAGWWPQGVDRPTDTPPVPPTLNWDLWLGPAPWRPYHPAYVPFKWRGFWDFGTGAIGDMGIHNLDTVFWALNLSAPTSVEVKSSAPLFKETAPLWSIIELHFPPRGKLPPVKMTWYDGGKQPPADLFHGEKIPTNGSLAIGSKGTLFTRDWHGGLTEKDMFLLLPRKTFAGYQPPKPTLPRPIDHHQEWIHACKTSAATGSNFAYASVLTESLLLGNVALRVGKRIEWDAKRMKVKGCPEADPLVRPEFRDGWQL
ncbi:MAG: Gfo/Idh/MocA family oxidoreductase [Verrucomicrobia bacterium]|nr:Gfo/Idh/MocA family oxidoreductase [Verrucomicrobiota bacterium]